MSTLASVIIRDLFANRPAAGIAGRLFFATDTGREYRDNGASWDDVTPGGPYDMVCSLVGKPGAGATVFLYTATRAVNFQANLAGSYGTVGVNPTATATYTINKNGAAIGTIAVATGGAVTFTTSSGAAQSLAPGDRMTIVAPSTQDTTLSDCAFTIAGSR